MVIFIKSVAGIRRRPCQGMGKRKSGSVKKDISGMLRFLLEQAQALDALVAESMDTPRLSQVGYIFWSITLGKCFKLV